MVKHSNQVPQSKFKKHWQRRVDCNFDQPQKAKKRRLARVQKAAKIFPRPLDLLRPLVRISNRKDNNRVRYGRGFSLAELKAAQLPVHFARTVGIAVDERRRNVSEEGLDANVQRLKEYKAKLVLFPIKNNKKPKKGPIPDSDLEALKNATQLKTTVLPVADKKPRTDVLEWADISKEDQKKSAFKRIRRARRAARNVGYIVKKKKAEAEGRNLKDKKKKE